MIVVTQFLIWNPRTIQKTYKPLRTTWTRIYTHWTERLDHFQPEFPVFFQPVVNVVHVPTPPPPPRVYITLVPKVQPTECFKPTHPEWYKSWVTRRLRPIPEHADFFKPPPLIPPKIKVPTLARPTPIGYSLGNPETDWNLADFIFGAGIRLPKVDDTLMLS